MRINYRLVKTWVNTLIRALGPTTSTVAGTRGTLPQPAPTNANAFFVAPNGSDANPGTLALPFLTIAFGVAALTGPRPTLVLIRNGFVGDLVFPVTTAVTFAASRNMQAAVGEAPIIALSGGVPATISTGASVWFNGIWFTKYDEGLIINATGAAGTSIRLENCGFIAPDIAAAVSTNNAYPILRSCYFYAGYGVSGTYNNGVVVDSCAFVGASEYTQGNRVGISFGTGAAINQTIDIARTMFARLEYAITDVFTGAAAAPGHLIVVRASAFVDVGRAALSLTNPSAGHNLRMTLSYTRQGAAALVVTENGLALPAGVVITISNPLPTDNPVLVTNYAGALAGDPEGLRLQVYGKQTPDNTGRWQINSPLYLAGVPLGFLDAAPWQESISGPTLTWGDDHEYTGNGRPKNIKITEEFTNPTSTPDILGNLHTRYDAARKKFELTWEDNYTNNNDTWRTGDIKRDLGTKQWYPKGLAGNVFTTTDNVVIATNATFAFAADPTTYIITPVAPTVTFTPNHWRGWWFIDEVSGNEYYITSNTETTLTIIDKLGVGNPTGGPAFPFRLPWMLVATPPEGYSIQQAVGFTEFQDGGALGAFTDRTTVRFEYQGSTLVLIEAEDAEDDLGF